VDQYLFFHLDKMAIPNEATSPPPTFRSLGLIEPLLEALEQVNYKIPTEIQAQCLPHALQGRDIIGVASTGSGKTAAFALPILQKLWEEPKGLFACVLAPTRELAFQISQQFESLGSAMGVRCAVIVGGVEFTPQCVALAKKPHVIVATPGRLQDHLEKTKGFSLRGLKYLVCIQNLSISSIQFILVFYRSWTKLIACWTWILVL
jgi:ATP-dependent RNA helicase DDX47/RRP3